MTAATISAPREDARTARYRQAERTLWDHYGLAPDERFVDVGSPPVRIRVITVGSGPPVFVAHGTAGSGPVVAAMLKELPDRTFLLMDRPGFGLSSPIRYSARTFRQTVADLQRDVLDALGIERADVVGHSIGGVFALSWRSTIRRGSGASCCWERARSSTRLVFQPSSASSLRHSARSWSG
jgi:pimeloyl-ACP methyl ester carboxylesterase